MERTTNKIAIRLSNPQKVFLMKVLTLLQKGLTTLMYHQIMKIEENIELLFKTENLNSFIRCHSI